MADNSKFKIDALQKKCDNLSTKYKVLKSMLPKEMIISKGTMIDNFKNLTGVTPQSCTATVDTTHIKYGVTSIKLVPTTPGANTNIYKTGLTLDLSTLETVSLWVYVEDASQLADIGIYLVSANGNFNYLHTNLINGWNNLKINKKYMNKSGTAAWTDTFTGFIARANMKTTTGLTNVYFNYLVYNVQTKPKVVFTFDDGYNGVYNLAYPYMKDRGIKGTSFVCKSLVGSSGYMPLSNLKEMYINGWDIANHTKSHIDLTSVTTAAALQDIKENKDYLLQNGFSRSINLLCYPVGYYNQALLDALPSLGINCARTITGIQNTMPPEDPLKLRTLAFGSAVTFSLLQAQLDLAILDGSTAIFTAHQVVSSGATGNQTNLDTFKQVVDYVIDKQIDIVTLSEWYEQLNL